MKTRLLTLVVLAALFLVSYGAFGVRSTMLTDDYWFSYPPNDFVAAGEDVARLGALEMARRVGSASGVSRFAKEFLDYWAFPLLRDHFWVVHLWIVVNHALNVGLLYAFLRRAVRARGPAFLGAALFAFWPLHCEVMFWGSTFFYHVGMSFALLAGIAWLRARPEAPGWWRRAWPVPLFILAASQWNEQAMVTTLALPAWALFAPAAGLRARALRFAGHSLFLAAPIGLWAIGYVTLTDVQRMTGGHHRNLPTRFQRTPLADLPRKTLLTLREQSDFLPLARLEREEIRGSFRRFPELAGDYPAAWALALLLPAAAIAAALLEKHGPDPQVEGRRLAAMALFGGLTFLYAQAPIAATREEWFAMRLGYAPGLGQNLALAAGLWWMWSVWTRHTGLAVAGRLALAGLLCLYALCNATEGWQYLKQHRIDLGHAEQIRRQLADDPGEPRWLLLAELEFFTQPLTIYRLDHIVNGWAYPWAGQPFLRQQGLRVDYAATRARKNGAPVIHADMPLDRMLRDPDHLYVFAFPPRRHRIDDARPRTYALSPVKALELVDRRGRTRLVPLPRMQETRDGSGEAPLASVRVAVRNLDALGR